MTIFNYSVNYVDLAFVAVLLLAALVGCRRGLLINVLRFVRWAAGIFLCFFVSDNYSDEVYNSFVKPKALDYISQQIATSKNLDEVMANLNTAQTKLPKAFVEMADFSKIRLSGSDIASSILESVFEPALLFLTKAGLFVAVFVVFFALTGLLIIIVNRHNRKKDREGKSTLRKADKALGLLIGIVKGVLIVTAASAVLGFAAASAKSGGFSNEFIKAVNNSSLVELINNINPLMNSGG